MAIRVPVLLAALLIAAGCGSGENSGGNAASSGEPSTSAARRVEKCVERFFERANSDSVAEADVRRYIERTYCSPFERNRWIHEDGTLSIGAYSFVARGYSDECASSDGGQGDTVSCAALPPDEPVVLDCAVLHLVRRQEVQQYVRELEQLHREVSCDDGTPVERLGAGS
jgi:hypothetical protein